jgi:hypothetical protein
MPSLPESSNTVTSAIRKESPLSQVASPDAAAATLPPAGVTGYGGADAHPASGPFLHPPGPRSHGNETPLEYRVIQGITATPHDFAPDVV